MNRSAATLIALCGASVALGAFGAHLLDGRLTPARLDTFDTAVRYLWMQAATALALGAYDRRTLQAVLPLAAAGTVLFSGSLLALVATNVGWWGAVAPVGGAAMIAAWIWAAWRLWRGGPPTPAGGR